MTALATIWAALRLQYRAAPVASTLTFGVAMTSGLAGAAAAWLLRMLIDALAAREAADIVVAIALALVAVGALGELLAQIGQHASTVIAARTTLQVDRTLFGTVTELGGLAELEDPRFHARLRQAEETGLGVPRQLSDLVLSSITTLVTVGSMLAAVMIVWPPMAGLLVVIAGCGVIAQLVRSRADVEALAGQADERCRREFYRSLLIDARAAKELRLFGIGRFLLDRMLGAEARITATEIGRSRRSLVVHVVVSTASFVASAVGILVVVRRTLAGELAIGDVALFLAAAAGIRGALAGVISQVGFASILIATFQSYLGIVTRPQSRRDATATLPPLHTAIELRDVWFRYDPGGPWVLRGVDLVIAAGSALGLVGKNGAGKSTLIKLLLRLYELERGAILWDGVDIREVALDALRARIAATFQDFMTYDLSAAENIGLGEVARIDDLERVRAAARGAEIDARIAALPEGYATLLSRVLPGDEGGGRPGVSLSGGEWQRIALARALMRREADLMILDEPNAGLDPDAERRVHAALTTHAAGKTRLLVSHRLSALRDADLIVVLADGRIVEHGTHDDLMSARGEYARLFTLQARGYQDARVEVA